MSPSQRPLPSCVPFVLVLTLVFAGLPLIYASSITQQSLQQSITQQSLQQSITQQSLQQNVTIVNPMVNPELPSPTVRINVVQLMPGQIATPRGFIINASQVVFLPEGVVASNPSSNSSTKVTPSTTPQINNWIEHAYFDHSAGFTYMYAEWIVPPNPTTTSNSLLIYWFPGIQSSSMIIQPVLQWGCNGKLDIYGICIWPGFGGNHWTLANWWADGQSGQSTVSQTPIQVYPGDHIIGVMTRSSDGTKWTISSYDATINNGPTTITVADSNIFWDSVATLEAYNVNTCSQLSGGVEFQIDYLRDEKGNLITPSWSPFMDYTGGTCGLDAANIRSLSSNIVILDTADPHWSSYSYPTSITLGGYADITLTVLNNAGSDISQTAHLSFPKPSSSVQVISSDMSANVYPAGSSVSGCYSSCTPGPTAYPFAEGAAAFTTGQTHYITVRVYPSQAGSFTVYFKTVALVNGVNKYFASDWDPTSGTTDQQNEHVNSFTITVTYSATFQQFGIPSGTTWGVNVGGTRYTSISSSLTVSALAGTVGYSYDSIIASASAVRYVCSSGCSGSVSGPTTVTANYKTQYYLTVNSVYDSPNPTSNWFDAGTSITASVTSPVSGGAGTRYVCTGWTGSGSVPSSGSVCSVSFNMNAPSSITWNWKTQYYLTMQANPSNGGTVSPGSNWWDPGSYVPISATANSGWQFTGWTGGGSGSCSGSCSGVTVNGPITETADFQQIVQVTITSSPTGSGFVRVDSTPITTPQVYSWVAGSSHTIAANPSVSCGSGCQYVWASWSDGGGQSHSIIVPSAATTYTATFRQQYFLTVSSAYDSPNPGSGWLNVGSSVPASVSSPVSGGSGTQYVCTGWSGTGSVPSSGSSCSVIFTLNAPSSITWNWKTQYYLTMQANPSNGGTVTPSSGWQDSGGNVPISASANTGWQFTGWTGSGSGSCSGSCSGVTMNGPITQTANFGVITTVTSNPTGSGYVTVDGGAVKTPQTFAWVIGSTHTIAAVSPVSCGTGCQYVFTAWSDGGSQSDTITVPGSPTTYTATFQKQYLLTLSYSVSGGGSGYSPPTFQADRLGSPVPVALTTTPTGYWFDYGSAWTATNPLAGSTSSERWFTTQATSGSIAGTSTLALKYQHQFYLTMQVNPSGAGSTTPSSNGWYNAGQAVAIGATAKTGLKFLSWTGTGTGSYSGPSSSATITMNAPITETVNFGVIITISSNPTGAGYVTVDGTPVRTPLNFAWTIGSTHTIAAVSPVSCGTGCQYVFTAWSDLGAQSHTITMPSSPTTYTATFQKQYLQTLSYSVVGGGSPTVPSFTANQFGSSFGQTLTTAPTGYWFDASSSWMITNPLSGSTSGERWYTSQAASGTISSSATRSFAYQHQFSLTLAPTPTGYGTVSASPSATWYNSGLPVTIRATATIHHQFVSWAGTGPGSSYTGTLNPTLIVMDGAITETATFELQQITLTVSYLIAGGGSGYSAPVLSYVLGTVSQTYTLTATSTPVLADWGSTWTVSPVTLGGSSGSERWQLNGASSGTVTSATTFKFTYQHQYYLTMTVTPSGLGTVYPSSGWYNSGQRVTIYEVAKTGYKFLGWTGTGTVSYTGTSAYATITMNSAITEISTYLSLGSTNLPSIVTTSTSESNTSESTTFSTTPTTNTTTTEMTTQTETTTTNATSGEMTTQTEMTTTNTTTAEVTTPTETTTTNTTTLQTTSSTSNSTTFTTTSTPANTTTEMTTQTETTTTNTTSGSTIFTGTESGTVTTTSSSSIGVAVIQFLLALDPLRWILG